jgi:hypothetical protein
MMGQDLLAVGASPSRKNEEANRLLELANGSSQ